jgi:hypothetical protein
MIYLIAYDLTTPNDTPDNYDSIINAIKSQFSGWCHIEKSVWLVDSELSASALRDELKGYLHADDILFVARLQGSWSSWNFGQKRNDWLKVTAF